jgi:hypothetical protein
MMETYLLTWNPGKSDWDEDYNDMQAAVELGHMKTTEWSCGVRKRMSSNSRIFMMRLGRGQPVHGIFLSGYTTEEPFSDDHWDPRALSPTTMYVRFRIDAMLNLEVCPLLDPEREVSSNRWC